MMPMLPKRDEFEEVEALELPEEEALEQTGVSISPEAVCYRDEQQVCGNCVYMTAEGECVPLKIPVEAGAGCNLFKGGDAI